jgi:hypothetical protein
MALEVPPHRYRFGPEPLQAIADIEDEGGWALIAHADHAWQAWHGGWAGTEGVEVINMAAAWSRQAGLARLSTVATSFVDADAAALRLLRYRWPTLAAWDARVALRRDNEVVPIPRVAIAGADAHGPFVGPVPSYADVFGALSTLVWIDRSPRQARDDGDARRAQRELMQALRRRRAAVETAALGDARAFSFVAESSRRHAVMGEVADFEDGPWRLRVDFETGADTEIVLLRDGVAVEVGAGPVLEKPVDEPGTYRVEAYRVDAASREESGPPWLVSNPIYLWPAPARAAARVHRVPPLPAPPISRDLLAVAEFEANERGVAANAVETADRVSWSFAMQPRSDEDAFAALAWRRSEPMDWSGADGMVVDLRAADTVRINLEVRTLAVDGAQQSWTHSLRAAPQRRAVAIPWSRFRAPWSAALSEEENIDPRRPAAADMERVEGVFLIVTPLLLQEGSEARVELHELGLYGER